MEHHIDLKFADSIPEHLASYIESVLPNEIVIPKKENDGTYTFYCGRTRCYTDVDGTVIGFIVDKARQVDFAFDDLE